MSFSAAVCPRCKEYILQKDGIPFLVCPICQENISARESAVLLDTLCSDPKKINEHIAKCLKLEEEFGPELPYKILLNLSERFPFNEEVAYLLVAMSDYSPINVKDYLTRFSGARKLVPFAVDFLENAMTFRNIGLVKFFESYIENKLPQEQKKRWIEKLQSMRSAYKGESDSPTALKLLYIYYILTTAVNIALVILFFAFDVKFFLSVLYTFIAFAVEIGVLFLHNKKFGNRLDINEKERLLMVIFMCSIVVAIGGVLLSTLY